MQFDHLTETTARRRSGKANGLVDTAVRLFHRNGFHATGIQQLLDEAGVSKMTLYGNFESKDDLILAALRKRDEEFRNWFEYATNTSTPDPRGRLLAMFETLDQWIRSDKFYGCMFINAAAEFGEPDNPVHLIAAEHKQLVQDYIVSLAENAGAPNPKKLARGLYLLTEGTIVDAHVRMNKNAAMDARAIAEIVIEKSFAAV